MDSRVVLLLRSVFPFTSRGGGGATPGLLLPLKRRRLRQPSPQHRVAHALSPGAYRRDLPTIGRWRASPVMAWDHFSPGGCRSHLHGSEAALRTSASEAGIRVPVDASAKGRCLAYHAGPCAVPRSLPAWPLRPRAFSGTPGDSWLAAYLWRVCRVRAGSSGRTRIRPGRLWRLAILLSSPHPFFWWYT